MIPCHIARNPVGGWTLDLLGQKYIVEPWQHDYVIASASMYDGVSIHPLRGQVAILTGVRLLTGNRQFGETCVNLWARQPSDSYPAVELGTFHMDTVAAGVELAQQWLVEDLCRVEATQRGRHKRPAMVVIHTLTFCPHDELLDLIRCEVRNRRGLT